jgi:ADP-ribose pyrophosphatase
MSTSAADGTRAWRTLSTVHPFATPWLKLRQDSVATHDGAIITYTFVDHPGFVTIVPVTPAGEVLLLRQYRYAAQTWCWELPAGAIEPGEDGRVSAQRELAEEVGGSTDDLRYIGAFYTTVGMSNQQCHVYLARDVEVGEMHLEPTELIDVVAVPWESALDMARAGIIANGPSALALMLCQPYVPAPAELLAAA